MHNKLLADVTAVAIASEDVTNRRRLIHIACWSFVVVYAMVAYSGIVSGMVANLWTDAAWTLAGFAAAIKSLHTAFQQKIANQRAAWLCYGLAALSWFVGMLIWDYNELIAKNPVPFPSLADAFFMGFAPLFVLGTIFFRLEMPNARFTFIQIGNLGIILSAIVMLMTIILYIPIKDSGKPDLFIAVAAVYPVLYSLAFFFALFCFWYYSWQRYRHVFSLLLGSLLLHAATVLLYSFELLGERFDAVNYINVYWLVAFALQFLAASEQDFLHLREPAEATAGMRRMTTNDYGGSCILGCCFPQSHCFSRQ